MRGRQSSIPSDLPVDVRMAPVDKAYWLLDDWANNVFNGDRKTAARILVTFYLEEIKALEKEEDGKTSRHASMG